MRARLGVAAVDEALAEAAGQAAGERDDAVGVGGELAHVERRLAAVQALEEAGRGELDEVAVAGVVGGQQREVVALERAPARAAAALGVVVDEVDLAADDRLDAVRAARLVELDRAVHDAVVGEPEGGLAELGGARGERVDLARAVEQRVLGVDVQMGAGRRAHGSPRIGGAPDGPGGAEGRKTHVAGSCRRRGAGQRRRPRRPPDEPRAARRGAARARGGAGAATAGDGRRDGRRASAGRARGRRDGRRRTAPARRPSASSRAASGAAARAAARRRATLGGEVGDRVAPAARRRAAGAGARR